MKKTISIYILLCFLVTSIMGPNPVLAQDFVLPAPGQMVALSPTFSPSVLKGIKLDPKNPFRFHFFVDSGDTKLSQNELKNESSNLIKYFLASLTIPEKDLWVNLSPYEKDRIVPQEFGKTEMGRDLLAEDYILKQITASLIYPESKLGKEFWQKVYAKAQAKYGTTNIPINTFNKVWIVPEKAVVYENGGVAFVLENHLKVMLEQDYLSLGKHEGIQSKQAQAKDTNQLGSQVVREIVIPALTREVNEGKNFSQLRQVLYSLILATWYKNKIKDSILNKIYSNQNKIAGINISKKEKNKIYQDYLKAFKKGVYNYIKEEPDLLTNQTIPRKYFSGGVDAAQISQNMAMVEPKRILKSDFAQLGKLTDLGVDFAMRTEESKLTDGASKAELLQENSNGGRTRDDLEQNLDSVGVYPGSMSIVKLDGGARILSTIDEKAFRDNLNIGLQFRVVEKGRRIANFIRWPVEGTSLDTIDRIYNIRSEVNRLIEFRGQQKSEISIVDYGCGGGVALMALAEEFRFVPNLKFYGYSDQFYSIWNKAPSNVTFILDTAENFLKYFKSGRIDFMYSYWGLMNAITLTALHNNYPDRLMSLLKPGAVLRTDNGTTNAIGNNYIIKEKVSDTRESYYEWSLTKLVTGSVLENKNDAKTGGIDLNPAQMSMQVKKDGKDFKFDFNGMNINTAHVTGATFTIFAMHPVTNLPKTLGLNWADNKFSSTSPML